MNILPVMSAGKTISCEYISKRWAASSTGTAQSAFLADTDTVMLDEELFVLEMVWRFRKSRGFGQYAEDMVTAEIEKEKRASQDRGTGRVRPESTGRDQPMPPTWSGTISS